MPCRLRHDPDAVVVVTEVLQPLDTAAVAIRQPLRSSGHNLVEPGTVDTAFGAWPVAPALSSIMKGSLNLGRMGICGEYVYVGPCVELSTACPMQKCMGSVVGADCIPRHTCRCRQQKTCSGSTQPSGACQVLMLSPFSALRQVSTAKTRQALTLQCFTADAASAAVAVATTCFWDAIWPHVLVVHPVHARDPVHLLPGLQAAEMAMVLYQHHHGVISTPPYADDKPS